MMIFDKSFLQALSVDEAVMLDQMFACVITPLFFVETMADLTKENQRGRTAEQIVGGLAERTPVSHSYLNSWHHDIILEELLGGYQAISDHRPRVPGAIPVRIDGKPGVVYKKAPETEAFERWQQGLFLELERRYARSWRESLAQLDLPAISQKLRAILRKQDRPKSLEAARSLASSIVNAHGHNFHTLLLAHALLDMPPGSLSAVRDAWRAAGGPPLRFYAPYTAHCLEVDLFFYLAMSNGLISDQRPSNRVDMSYLYYLPFAPVFVSGDKLHRGVVPLFLSQDQQFLWAPDLKADLSDIQGHFDSLSAEEKAKGLFTLASSPPVQHQGLCADMWDRYSPGWRNPKPPKPSSAVLNHADILTTSKRLVAAAETAPPAMFRPGEDVQHLVIERFIPKQRGSWRMFSPEVEAAGLAETAERNKI